MMFELVKMMSSNRKGQGMVEYGLLLSLISVAAIAVLLLLGPAVTATFQAALDALN